MGATVEELLFFSFFLFFCGGDCGGAFFFFLVLSLVSGRRLIEGAVLSGVLIERSSPSSPLSTERISSGASLINEPNAAKVLFREAFYLGADQIIIDTLESALIKNLIISIKKEGITQDIEEWLPVYGNISGTFNVKRELKPVEYGRLKQSIFKLESRVNMNPELKENSSLTTTQGNSESSLVPKLINRYFWLIDHYLSTNEKSTKINEILERLKHLDVAIYQKYVT